VGKQIIGLLPSEGGGPTPPTCNAYLWVAPITIFDAPGSPGILESIYKWSNDGGITEFYDAAPIVDLGFNPPRDYYSANTNPWNKQHGFFFNDPYNGDALYVWFISNTKPLFTGIESVSNNTVPILFEKGKCADEVWDLCCWVYGDDTFGSLSGIPWVIGNVLGFNRQSSFNTYGDSFLFQNNLQNMIDSYGGNATATVTVVGSDTFIQLSGVNKFVFDTDSYIIDSNLNQWFFTECI
jgi:hypothetical protein